MAKSLYDYCIERDDFRLLAQWDKEKNGELTVRDVARGSSRKVWWRCEFNHQWAATVYSRSTMGAGCPYCAGKRVQPFSRTLASEHPQLLEEWHPKLNADISPEELTPGSSRRVWWKCSKGHEWRAVVKSRVTGTGCPVCANRKVIPGENDLATRYPEIAAQWHPVKNGKRTPRDVVAGNCSKVWWLCDNGHEWQAPITSRTCNGNGCPVCSGKAVVPGENDLASSFPAVAAQWHPTKNGDLTPDQFAPYSNRKVWWQCNRNHTYLARIAKKVQESTGCPYCSNRKVLVGFNDLATTDPEIAEQWQRELNGELTPQMVTAGCHKKVWWQCRGEHVWKAVIYSRTGPQRAGCPVCAGKVREDRKDRYTMAMASQMFKNG